jgi:hydrogenase maturation protease
MQPDVVLGVLDTLGAAGSAGSRPARILVVGCEPASVDYGMELSEPVAKAVDEAVRVVLDLVAEAGRGRPETPPQTPETTDKGVSHVPWHSR